MKMKSIMKIGAVWALLAAFVHGLAAADGLPQVHALTGVKIVVAPGQEIESGTVVLRNGVIEAVGADVPPPAGARIWDREGATVYAGLIESYSPRSWPGADADKDDDAAAVAQGGHDNVLVTPERDMSLHGYHESDFNKLRGAGFTSAVFSPSEGGFRGRGVLMNLGEGGLADNLLLRDVAHNITLRTANQGYPNSTMGAVALTRQTLYDALWYGDAHSAYEANPRQERPPFHTALAELVGVARGRFPVVFETSDVLDTLRVATIVDEFGLDAMVVGNGKEYQRLDAVVATDLTHLLPVDFPDPPDVGEKDTGTVGLADLRHWDLAPENPARLTNAGATVAFTTHRLSDPKDIYSRLATAIERGLDPDRALAGLTTIPAKLFGLEDRLGSVEVGKMANLVVVEGDLFTDKPKLREVWIDGKHIELKDIKPPEVNPAGTWELSISAGGQQMTMMMEFIGTMDDLSGSINTPGGKVPFSSIEVSGKTVEITFDGASVGAAGEFSFNLTLDGEKARGSGNSPMGPFALKAKRTSKPDGSEARS